MAPLRQKQFAKLFSEAMDILDVPGVRLAKAIGQHPTTISRYRSPEYKSGPPEPARRRILEDEMGLPRGYLDGTVDADLMAIRRSRQQGRGPNGQTGADDATLRAVLQNLRTQMEGVLRQLELAERLAGGTDRRPSDGGLDPAAVVDLAEPRRSGPTGRGHRRHA